MRKIEAKQVCAAWIMMSYQSTNLHGIHYFETRDIESVMRSTRATWPASIYLKINA